MDNDDEYSIELSQSIHKNLQKGLSKLNTRKANPATEEIIDEVLKSYHDTNRGSN